MGSRRSWSRCPPLARPVMGATRTEMVLLMSLVCLIQKLRLFAEEDVSSLQRSGILCESVLMIPSWLCKLTEKGIIVLLIDKKQLLTFLSPGPELSDIFLVS